MDRRTNSQVIGLIALMALITGVTAYFSLRSGQPINRPPLTVQDPVNKAHNKKAVTQTDADPDSQTDGGSARRSGADEIIVHVAGAVRRPGVYHLIVGARITDAISAAGGLLPSADPDSINLAEPARDGTRIDVLQQRPSTSGDPNANLPGSNSRLLPGDPPARSGIVEIVPGRSEPPSTGAEQAPASFEHIVNINIATAEELQTLPGIGPALAQRIITYRVENGAFNTPEDLMQVSGIGQKRFDKIRPRINVR